MPQLIAIHDRGSRGEATPGETQCPDGEQVDAPVTGNYAPNDALLLLLQ